MRVYIYIKRYTILHHKIPCMYIYTYIYTYVYIYIHMYVQLYIKNIPPDWKPRVEALTFVNNLCDTKCIKREVSAHFNLFLALFRGNSMEFFFWSCRAVEMMFFSVLQIQNRGCNEYLWVIFPRLPVEIGTVQPSNACCTVFAVVFKMSLHILM